MKLQLRQLQPKTNVNPVSKRLTYRPKSPTMKPRNMSNKMVVMRLKYTKSQIATDDAGNLPTSESHVPRMIANDTYTTKRNNLAVGTGVVPAKHPPKVKLEIFSLLQSAREGKLCVPWFVRVLGFLQQRGLTLFSLEQKSFPYRSLLGRILRNPFHIEVLRFHETWGASYLFVHVSVQNRYFID